MKKIAVALMLCCGLASGVFADKDEFSASILAGYAIPIADFSDNLKGSFALAGAGDYQFHDMLAAGLELGYNFKHDGKDLPAGVSGEAKILYITPYLKVLHKKDKMTFYGILGAGWYNTKTEMTVATITTDTTSDDFGINVGGGLMFDVGENMQAGVDVKWHHVFTDGTDIDFITPSGKFCFFFGK